MILKLHGHIGSHASALVDGQLCAEDEERAWQHVLSCPGCRRLVEKEGWIKQQLAGLARPRSIDAPEELLGTLYDVHSWPIPEQEEQRSARRRTLGLLAGAGSAGLAVMALITVASPPAGRGEPVPNPAPVAVRPNGSPNGITAIFNPAPTPTPGPNLIQLAISGTRTGSGSGSGSDLAPASLRRATR